MFSDSKLVADRVSLGAEGEEPGDFPVEGELGPRLASMLLDPGEIELTRPDLGFGRAAHGVQHRPGLLPGEERAVDLRATAFGLLVFRALGLLPEALLFGPARTSSGLGREGDAAGLRLPFRLPLGFLTCATFALGHGLARVPDPLVLGGTEFLVGGTDEVRGRTELVADACEVGVDRLRPLRTIRLPAGVAAAVPAAPSAA